MTGCPPQVKGLLGVIKASPKLANWSKRKARLLRGNLPARSVSLRDDFQLKIGAKVQGGAQQTGR